MLKPNQLSIDELNSVKKRISSLSKRLNIVDLNSTPFLQQSNIYQFDLPELPNGIVILGDEVYNVLSAIALATQQDEKKLHEYGCFLFGKEISDNCILFGGYSSSFPSPTACSIKFTDKMMIEMVSKTKNQSIDCICHVHSHPFTQNMYSSTPSNQDLYTYAYLQNHSNEYNHLQSTNKDLNFLGCLIAPSGDPINYGFSICFIFYDKKIDEYFKITNIKYYDEKGVLSSLPNINYVEPKTGSNTKAPIILKREIV